MAELRYMTANGVRFAYLEEGAGPLVLLVHGFPDYERARRWYAARHEIVHMPGGHFLHREHPTRFISELLRVLSLLAR